MVVKGNRWEAVLRRIAGRTARKAGFRLARRILPQNASLFAAFKKWPIEKVRFGPRIRISILLNFINDLLSSFPTILAFVKGLNEPIFAVILSAYLTVIILFR
jgi:hypothetical protein